ncbi:serine/threonine-protein kinase unc-51-like [Tropilaelaps mercedesae]|uniref:Serine/threonine-protein kinase unc-51-like n=1 Tax=Tropilaelaps mercedesae TaxID=418985 RepID=A0A1V9X515_9ACAR|nr:serine/threonine-protein kinase unc-51-like [Tropilaelaps mercedesae]
MPLSWTEPRSDMEVLSGAVEYPGGCQSRRRRHADPSAVLIRVAGTLLSDTSEVNGNAPANSTDSSAFKKPPSTKIHHRVTRLDEFCVPAEANRIRLSFSPFRPRCGHESQQTDAILGEKRGSIGASPSQSNPAVPRGTPDVEKLTPPSSNFMIGTPVGVSPPFGPGSANRHTYTSSPIRIGSHPTIGSHPLGARAMTLPELASETGAAPSSGPGSVGSGSVPCSERSLQRSGSVNALFTLTASALLQVAQNRYNDSMFDGSPPSANDLQLFVAPELPAETILDRAHNETLAKLNFVHALVVCILELAKSRAAGELANLEAVVGQTDSRLVSQQANGQQADRDELGSQLMGRGCSLESYRQAEQLVLHLRAVHLLSSALNLAKRRILDGSLQLSPTVKDLLRQMKNKLQQGVQQCTALSDAAGGLTKRALTDPQVCQTLSADRLLYNHAIEMCQSAALEELFGSPHESFKRYQTAQILLHCLTQQVEKEEDKLLLSKYKTAVERRLTNLQLHGPDVSASPAGGGTAKNSTGSPGNVAGTPQPSTVRAAGDAER